MVSNITNRFTPSQIYLNNSRKRTTQPSFTASEKNNSDTVKFSNSSKEDKVKIGSGVDVAIVKDGEVFVSQDMKSKIAQSILKQELEAELKCYIEKIPELSRSELAKERFDLDTIDGKIYNLEKLGVKRGLTAEEAIKLEFLNKKLEIIKQREAQIEKSLEAYHPGDTVGANSSISSHQRVMGYNQHVRYAMQCIANHFAGLEADEIRDIIEIKKMINCIDKEFKELPPLEKDCIVYKGISESPAFESHNEAFRIMSGAKCGDIVVPDRGYTYTAFDRSVAENWGGEGARLKGLGGEDKRVMMYEIFIPKGAKVSRKMNSYGEILMPRGAKYRVVDKKILNNGDIEVKLEYLLEGDK